VELVEAGHPIKTIILEKPPGKIGYVLITEGAPVKRPPKRPDRAYPLVKNQEYAYAYDWEHGPG
jgi:hypothetical protein